MYEVIVSLWFWFALPLRLMVMSTFSCICWPSLCLLGKMSIKFLCLFLNWVVFSPLLSCMSSSYILDINPLSGRWFGDFSCILYAAFHFVDDLLCWQLCYILISGFCTCLHLLAPISGLLSSAFWLVKPSALLCLGSPTTSPVLICEGKKNNAFENSNFRLTVYSLSNYWATLLEAWKIS